MHLYHNDILIIVVYGKRNINNNRLSKLFELS